MINKKLSRRNRMSLSMITEKRLLSLLVCLPLLVSACAPADSTGVPAILLFDGHGTSPNDVTALEQILGEHRFSYRTVDSAQLETMTASQLKSYRLVLVPGGNFVEIGNGLTTSTAARLRAAVGSGVNYLGICGGAFFAGNSPYNGLNLTSGARFRFYTAEERGIRKTAVAVTPAGSAAVDHYWEDGPELSGWGEVVAKYPDGTPAVVQGTFGDGWVVLTGVHPEAPETWRRGLTFTTPASAAHAYAATLIDAALRRTRLPHY
jgi:Biotin-protein ligase, N terminal